MCFLGAGLRPVIGWRAGKYSYKQFDNFFKRKFGAFAEKSNGDFIEMGKWRKCLSKDSMNLTL